MPDAPDRDEARLAVALRYAAPAAPTVVATGRGHLAEAILARARESGVPIEQNPLLAAALASLEVDETIPEDLYRAVAAVVALVMRAAGVEEPEPDEAEDGDDRP